MQNATPLARLGPIVLDKALALSAFGLPLLSSLVVVNAVNQHAVNRSQLSVSLATMVFPLLWLFRNQLPFRLAANLLLLLLGLTSFALQLRGGLVTATGAIPILMIVLAGLFFGRPGSLWCLLLTLLGMGVSGYLVVNGLVPPVIFASWDPNTAQPWIRGMFAILVFGGGTATAVIYVCERLELETRDLQVARARETIASTDKLRAEAERESAQRALSESHRLESLGRLAGGIAHDFNNILTVIMGNTELALKQPGLDDKVRNYLAEIQRASLHSTEITQELLMLSRKDPAQVQVLDVGEILQRVQPTLQRLVPDDIKLSLDVVANGMKVRMTQVSLERILLNLLANARDAISGAGTIEMVVTRRPAREAGEAEWVQLSVRDSGAGLDAATLDRIFEPFFTTKKIGSGSGLGLTLVQSMVFDAGGTITVDSAPGKGTTITLLLPRIPQGEIDKLPLSGGNPANGASKPGLGRTILVVDDQLAVLATIVATLEHAGFNVITGTNGDEALQLIEDPAVKFDLLCLDGVMPGASSARVIERLRQLRAATEVILCSGYVDEELLLRGIKVGELTLVRKPFRPSELIATIQAKLDKST